MYGDILGRQGRPGDAVMGGSQYGIVASFELRRAVQALSAADSA